MKHKLFYVKHKLVYGLVIFLIFLAVLAIHAKFNRNFRAAIPLIGDEPSYMAMADSLVHFQTFNLKQEVETKHYRNFFIQDNGIDNGIHAVDLGEKQFPKHGLAWSIILAPLFFFWSDPRFGAMILQNIIVALLAINLVLWLRELKYNFWLSLFVVLVIVFSLPISVQSHFLFSEPLAALTLIYALRKWPRPNWLSTLGIALLPWIHIKYFAFYPLLLWSYFKINQEKRFKIQLKYPWLVAIIGISIAAISVFNIYAYGSIFSGQEKISSFFQSYQGLLGILLNRENGLFTSAPIYILAFLGLGALLAKKVRVFWPIIYSVGILWLITGIFHNWDGGQAPSARMILVTLPLLAPALAEVLILPLKWVFRFLFMLLLMPGLILSLQGLWQPVKVIDKELYPNLNFMQQALNLPIDLEKWFPGTHLLGWNLNLLWLVILIGLFIGGFYLVKFRKKIEAIDEIIHHYPGL